MGDDLLSRIDSCNVAAVLQPYFSERAVMSSRIYLEVQYLLALSKTEAVGCRRFTDDEQALLQQLHNITPEEFDIIKVIERKTDHDVKAVEYFMRQRLTGTSLEDCCNWIHFGLTSEDVNNIAISLNMQRFLREVYRAALHNYCEHGAKQNIAEIYSAFHTIDNFKFTAKLMGATGTLAAHKFALPEVDWLAFSKNFIESFWFKPNMVVTQVEPKDSYAELFQSIILFHEQIIFGDKSRHKSIKKAKEAISSLRKANALFQAFANKLPASRLQRDLSDSTVQRNFGVAFGYSLLGLQTALGEEPFEEKPLKEKNAAVKSKPTACDAISPLVGRYYKDVQALEQCSDITSAIFDAYIPAVTAIITHLTAKAHEYAHVPMLARTHGKPATPTTVGKEYAVFAERLNKQVAELKSLAAIDLYILKTAEIAYTIARINTIIKDLAIDFWLYIKDEWILQKNLGTVGSSTMPHKINPIHFENAEGNVCVANALLYGVASSDLTGWKEAVGYSLLVAKSVAKGLEKTTVNIQKVMEELRNHPEVIAEAYQTELRKPEYNIADPYALLKDFTQRETNRGNQLTLALLHAFVDNLPIPDTGKNKLKSLSPETYLGYAKEIAKK